MNALFAMHDIEFTYPEQPALLHGVDLSLNGGEAVAILGRNGTGKTTLLHIALGWLRPAKGAVKLRGRPLASYSRRELGTSLSLVPQSEHVAFDYTVLEYVLLGRAPYLAPTEVPGLGDIAAARAALERVGIVELQDRPAARLSGGELQLVLLARSLAQEPRILLLDEPSAHLDISNKVRLLRVLRQLQADGVALLFSTHDADFAAALSDRTALLDEGRFIAVGPPEQSLTGANLSRIYRVPVTVRIDDGTVTLRWH